MHLFQKDAYNKKDKDTKKILGTTVEDAIGECFDKAARMLKLPYPGGPEIEKLALSGNPNIFKFKTPKLKDNSYNFSFSGLKTKVLYTVYGQNGKQLTPIIEKDQFKDIAAAFQEAAFNALSSTINRAEKNMDVKSLLNGFTFDENSKMV